MMLLFFFIVGLVALCMAVMFRIYVKDVLPTLDKHGRPAYWMMTPSGQAKQLEEYRRICIEHGYTTSKHQLHERCRVLGLILLSVGVGVWIFMALRGGS